MSGNDQKYYQTKALQLQSEVDRLKRRNSLLEDEIEDYRKRMMGLMDHIEQQRTEIMILKTRAPKAAELKRIFEPPQKQTVKNFNPKKEN